MFYFGMALLDRLVMGTRPRLQECERMSLIETLVSAGKRVAELKAELANTKASAEEAWREVRDLSMRDGRIVAKLEAERDQLAEKYEANTAILHARTKRMEELRAEKRCLQDAINTNVETMTLLANQKA